MNKGEMIKLIADKHGYTIQDVETIVNAFFKHARNILHERERVAISGFGSFVVNQRAARTALNPRTQEIIDVPAKEVVQFIPGKSLLLK
ncbi:MAG: HU family DNA-binding protein [Tannerellaceae bacterium]